MEPALEIIERPVTHIDSSGIGMLAAKPMSFPATGPWLVRILARENRFVVGLYRRHMKVIGYLGALDRVFSVPATTRNWNTLPAIARVLSDRGDATSVSSRRGRK